MSDVTDTITTADTTTVTEDLVYEAARHVRLMGHLFQIGEPIQFELSPPMANKLLHRRVIRLRGPARRSVAPEVPQQDQIGEFEWRGQTRYYCKNCQFDSMSLERIQCHVSIAHPDPTPFEDDAFVAEALTLKAGVSVVVLSYYPDLFLPLQEQLDLWEPDVRKVLVTSGPNDFGQPTYGWEHIPGIEPFCFARNANLGIRACGGDDVFLINDDARINGPVLERLRVLAHRNPDIGILSPQVKGGVGNPIQSISTRLFEDVVFPTQRLAFVAIYIKRSTIDRIGEFDERFTGYGCEDTDYSHRVCEAGLKAGVTPRVIVEHGDGKYRSSCSFLRSMSRKELLVSLHEMREKLDAKWGRI